MVRALHVFLSGDSIISGWYLVDVEHMDEPILDAFARSYLAKTGSAITARWGADASQLQYALGRWAPRDDSGDTLFLAVTREVTVEQFSTAFGQLTSEPTDGLIFPLDGLGGDTFCADLTDQALSGLAVYDYVKRALTIADRWRFQEHRREAESWEDSGNVSMRLEQLVRAEGQWTPKEFTRRFGVGGRDRGTLLNALGYEARGVGRHKRWTEASPT